MKKVTGYQCDKCGLFRKTRKAMERHETKCQGPQSLYHVDHYEMGGLFVTRTPGQARYRSYLGWLEYYDWAPFSDYLPNAKVKKLGAVVTAFPEDLDQWDLDPNMFSGEAGP